MPSNLKLLLLAPDRIDSNLRGVIVDDPDLIQKALTIVLSQKHNSRMVVGAQPEVLSDEEVKALFTDEPPKSEPPSVSKEPPKPPSPTIPPLRVHDVGNEAEPHPVEA